MRINITTGKTKMTVRNEGTDQRKDAAVLRPNDSGDVFEAISLDDSSIGDVAPRIPHRKSSARGLTFQAPACLYCGEISTMTEQAFGTVRVDELERGDGLVVFEADQAEGDHDADSDGSDGGGDLHSVLKLLIRREIVVLRSVGRLVTFGGLIVVEDTIGDATKARDLTQGHHSTKPNIWAIHFDHETDACCFEHLLNWYANHDDDGSDDDEVVATSAINDLHATKTSDEDLGHGGEDNLMPNDENRNPQDAGRRVCIGRRNGCVAKSGAGRAAAQKHGFASIFNPNEGLFPIWEVGSSSQSFDDDSVAASSPSDGEE